MPPQHIPIAEGGVGSFTWDKSQHTTNRYHVRQGRDVVASIVLTDRCPDPAAVLNAVCAALDNPEGDTTP